MPEADSTSESKPTPRLGSYTLVQALGSGGMSSVFRAVHEESGSVVAVKVLPRTLARNATLLQRFMREAKSAEALDHPNIVAIYDRGYDQGRHYLVLEYVEGRDMHDRVRLTGPLDAEEAVRFIRQVAEGLRYAADQGMIHRDVKPANLLMTPEGQAKIIDLGLALQIEDEDERVTRDGTTVGTVDYMAPEQARDSHQTSERSDIYSLGCTFYYLMTGSAPYPGGGLSDKLARHYKAPIPDVRQHRPDVSESLSLLIRRMMEKKPERRFADYTQLIETLDALDDPPTQETGDLMDALIVDDDDDENGLLPTESAMHRSREDRPPSSLEGFLTAEIVDDDEDDPAPTLPPPGPKPRAQEAAKPKPKPVAPSGPTELSLADLAALDADDPPARRPVSKASPSASSSTSRAASNPAQAVTRAPSASFATVPDDDEDDEEVYGDEGTVRKGAGSEVSLKTWISAGVMVGLAIAILAFGASVLIPLTKPAKPPEDEIKPPLEVADASDKPYEVKPIHREGGPRPVPKKEAEKKENKQPTPEIAAVVAPTEESPYSADWQTKLAAPTIDRPAPTGDPKATVVVRRAIQGGDEIQFSSIAAAFSRGNDLVEIADIGPFFEDDCLIAGKSRLIRARGGVRPMIKIERTENAIVKSQAAKFVLGGSKVEHLIFEGIDLAVDVRDLPVHQSTLFLCQGVDLTLRDCSLTVINANDPTRTTPFSIFRLEEAARPNRIVLDRTLIRGPVGTLVDIASTRAEVVVSRSLILGDASPLIQSLVAEKPARSFYFYRSIVATKGHVIDFVGRPNPLVVRSLGTIFARTEGGTSSAPTLFASRAAIAGEPPTVLDWSGEDNEFLGWSGWLTAGSDASIRVAGLDAVKSTWPNSDGSSRELPSPWPTINDPDKRLPIEFEELAPHRKPTLAKIASPHPRLRDLTFGSLTRLETPELSDTLISPNAAPTLKAGGGGAPPSVSAPKAANTPPPEPVRATGAPKTKAVPPGQKTGPTPKKGGVMQGGTPAPPPPPGPLTLTFDVREGPWYGDLGLYLAEKLVPGTPRATVTVKGGGIFATSPIRFADGLSIAIIGDSTDISKLPMPTFVPRAGNSGVSMFEIRGGDLAIANLGFAADAVNRPRHWVRSEDGILALRHCRFREVGASSGVPTGEPTSMIAFVAKGTAPIPRRVGPLAWETDRPTARLKNCLIWTAGEAISAEVGRGVVDLENCLIISGGTAINLRPVDVARDKFEADLVLNRCTIAPDKTGILLGVLAGIKMGPNRPWLVSSKRCAFPRSQPSGASGALLQVDPDALARGVLFWQSTYDAYDCTRLLASTGPQPSSVPSANVKKQWIDIWGPEHTRGDSGPTAARNEAVLRYKDRERPKPGKITPATVEVDLEVTDHGVNYKDLPPTPKAAFEPPPVAKKSATDAPAAGKGAFGPRTDPR